MEGENTHWVLPFHFLLHGTKLWRARMIHYLIWVGSIALEVLIFIRGCLTGLFRRYRVFYIYILAVVVVEGSRFWIHTFHFKCYKTFYWVTDFFLITGSYVVLFEIFRQILAHYPPVARLAQQALLFVLIVGAPIVALRSAQRHFELISEKYADLARDVRCVEAFLLLVVLWILAHYHISLGRNTIGLTLGFAFLVGTDLTYLELLLKRENAVSVVLPILHTMAYVITLVIWTHSLWRAVPVPSRAGDSRIQQDYEILAERIRNAIDEATKQILRLIKRR